MAGLGWRLLVLAGAGMLVGLQLLLSQSETGAASSTPPAGAITWGTARLDESGPRGCVQVVGAPPFPGCEPCPPLWLGGPTIRCLSKPSPVVRFAPPALGFGVLVGRRCPGLPRWVLGSGDAMLATRLCAYSAGE